MHDSQKYPTAVGGKRWPTSLVQDGVYAVVCAGFESYAVNRFSRCGTSLAQTRHQAKRSEVI